MFQTICNDVILSHTKKWRDSDYFFSHYSSKHVLWCAKVQTIIALFPFQTYLRPSQD